MKYSNLTDGYDNLKQHILINKNKNKNEIETVTYIDNLRISDIFNENGDWEGYKVVVVKYVEDYKISQEIKTESQTPIQNETKHTCFCKGYVDPNELKKRL